MPALSVDDAPNIPADLLKWLRDFTVLAQAPAGQPNLVAENLKKIGDYLEQYSGDSMLAAMVVQMHSAIDQVNAACVGACNIRRPACGGSASKHCDTCPRHLGTALDSAPIPG